MTPSVPELLGCAAAVLTTPPSADDAGDFHTGKLGAVALLSILAAQECATGAATRVWENNMLRTLLAEAAPGYDPALSAPVDDGDLSLAALDAANAELRRRLIQLHAAAEAAGDSALDRRILTLYRAMAQRRELHLPYLPTDT